MYLQRFSPSQPLIAVESLFTEDDNVTTLVIYKTEKPTHYYGSMEGELWHLTKNEVDNKVRTFIRMARYYGYFYNDSEIKVNA